MAMNIPMDPNALHNECAGIASLLAEALHNQLGVDYNRAQDVITEKLRESPSPLETIFRMGVEAREKTPGKVAMVGIRQRPF